MREGSKKTAPAASTRSGGDTVRWRHGQMATRSDGDTVRWRHGQMATRSDGDRVGYDRVGDTAELVIPRRLFRRHGRC